MSKSLQDQLLALGLAKTAAKKAPHKPPASKSASDQRAATEKSASDRRAATEKRGTERKPTPKQPARPARPNPRPERKLVDPRLAENISLEQAYRIREAEEKSAKQRARERKLEDDRKRAILNRQIRQIIDSGRLNLPDAAEARYFLYKDRIRKVHVNPEQLTSLNNGELGVVYLAGGYHILVSEQVEEVRKLSPAHVPDLLVGGDDEPYDETDFTADELRANGPAAAQVDSKNAEALASNNADESPKVE